LVNTLSSDYFIIPSGISLRRHCFPMTVAVLALLVLLPSCLIAPTPVWAAEACVLRAEMEEYDLRPFMEFWRTRTVR